MSVSSFHQILLLNESNVLLKWEEALEIAKKEIHIPMPWVSNNYGLSPSYYDGFIIDVNIHFL